MTAGLTYTTFQTAVSGNLVIDTANDENWASYLPLIVDGAELRMLRELDPLCARKDETATYNTATATPGRIATPADAVVFRELGYYTPAGNGADTNGSYNQLFRRDPGFLRELWGNRSTTGVPKYWGVMDTGQLLIAPSPDANYVLHMFMTARLSPLYTATSGNYLSLNYPDLYLYAALVVGSGLYKNYGALANDPQAPMTWEKLYQTALTSALDEEKRRKTTYESDASATQPAATIAKA